MPRKGIPRPDLPRSIKGKITEFERAVRDHAFIGSQHPEDHEEIEEAYESARYDLEQTIRTHLHRMLKKETTT